MLEGHPVPLCLSFLQLSLPVWSARKVYASARLQGPQPGLTHTLRPAELSKAQVQGLESDELDESDPSDNEVGPQPHTLVGPLSQDCPRLGGRSSPDHTPTPLRWA